MCRPAALTGTTRYRGINKIAVTAEVDRTAGQSLDYTTGVLIIDRDNRAVANDFARSRYVRYRPECFKS